jgi:hypothetical protein
VKVKEPAKSTFKLIKVEGEEYLYRHSVSLMYYVRDGDSRESLGTTRIDGPNGARKLRDEWFAKKNRVKLGLAPDKGDLPRLRIVEAISDYERSGFSSIRHGNLWECDDAFIHGSYR